MFSKPAGWFLATAVCVALPASAAINYGNFDGNTVMYSAVTEDSSTDTPPLFGAPTISNDSLVFNPASFGSASSGAGDNDITDGTLTTTVMAHPGHGIGEVVLNEKGDVTLIGSGGIGTFAAVTATLYATVLDVDGVGITPFTVSATATFSPSNGDFDLFNDGVLIGLIWSGNLTMDVGAEVAGHGYTGVATRLNLAMDNILVTTSEDGTSATIKKKELDGTSVTIIPPTVIPEPASVALVGTSLICLGAWTRRRTR